MSNPLFANILGQIGSAVNGAVNSAPPGSVTVGSAAGSGNNGLVGCSAPPQPTLQQLDGYPIGTQITIGPCVPQPATLYNHCATTLGSEWGNDVSVPTGVGALLSCTKTNYSGTLSKCCLGQAPGGLSSCNPGATPNSAMCASTMQSYCNGANLWSSPCMSWGTSDITGYNDAAASYCFSGNNMLTDSNCANWALSSTVKGTIDNQMQKFCLSNPNHSLCGCINSPITPCPEKYDKNCITGGYLTATMLSTACPTVMNCNQYVNLPADAKSVLVDTAINQNCSSSTSNGGGAPSVSSVNTSTPVSSSNTYYYYILFVILIIVVVIALRRNGGVSGSVEKIKHFMTFR